MLYIDLVLTQTQRGVFNGKNTLIWFQLEVKAEWSFFYTGFFTTLSKKMNKKHHLLHIITRAVLEFS